jgi:hypothetical protein
LKLRRQGHAFVHLKHIWLFISILVREGRDTGVNSVGRNHRVIAIGEVGAGKHLLSLVSIALT